MPQIPAIDRFYRSCDASARAARIALRLAAHRQARGEYPVALGELQDAASLPRDPFSGEPFHYRREATGFLLWSVGPDSDDDGGKTSHELFLESYAAGRPEPLDCTETGDEVFAVPPRPSGDNNDDGPRLENP